MICNRTTKINGVRIGSVVRFRDEICRVVGADLEDNTLLITYSTGWSHTFINKSSEIESNTIIIHPCVLNKDNRYYWVRAKYLEILDNYDKIIEI